MLLLSRGAEAVDEREVRSAPELFGLRLPDHLNSSYELIERSTLVASPASQSTRPGGSHHPPAGGISSTRRVDPRFCVFGARGRDWKLVATNGHTIAQLRRIARQQGLGHSRFAPAGHRAHLSSGQANAAAPVMSRPTMSVWIVSVPS